MAAINTGVGIVKQTMQQNQALNRFMIDQKSCGIKYQCPVTTKRQIISDLMIGIGIGVVLVVVTIGFIL